MSCHRTIIRLSAVLAGVALAWSCGGDDSPTVPPTPEPARPTMVTVSPATHELTAWGITVQLSAEVRDQNARVMGGATVTWTSSASSVATVDASGLVTAAGNGTATITASAGSASGSAVVTVTQSVASVEVSPSVDELTALGATVQLTAEAFDANGHAVAGAEFSWESSDDAVATVDESGLVTGVSKGVATITARAGDASGSAVVSVMQPVASVEVSPSSETIGLGSTLQLTAEGFDENGDAVAGVAFSWESSDVAVATVDNRSGLVTGVTVGVATITASAGSGQGTSEITVTNPERAALEALYEILDGPNWRNNDNWLTDAPLGEWYGVDTDAEGRVSWLELAANSLTGPIPPELGNLANLTALELGVNSLTGPIPPELGNLANLTRLWLAANSLTGPIPPELGNLANLRYLYLPENELTGPIPAELGRLANLTELHLWRNSLTGPIPPELGNLANLTVLELRANSLTGPIPPELANLANLKKLVLPAGVCVPADLRAWAVKLGVSVFPCSSEGRLLPSALMREDGNGLSLALPDDLREPSAVTVDDPSVVAVSVADGWLELVPRGRGSAEVEVVPSGGGAPASARVVVRAAVGTFGIDIVMDRPAPVSYEKALTTGADWWSSVLDGTEWPDRRPTCFNDRATALADELLIHASIDLDTQVSGYAHTCFRSSGEQAALDPGGGGVTSAPHSSTLPLVRHEIGHLLGLVLWPPETGLVTGDGAYFVGPRAVKAFRESGGDPGLPGVPLSPDRAHWATGVKDFMASFRPEGAISAAALADAGYTVDMTKANTLLGPYNAQAVVDPAGDVVPAEPRRLPRDGSGGGAPPR